MELSKDGLSPPGARNMNRKTITNICTIPAALFLVLIGIVHSTVNFSGLRRGRWRGGDAARPWGWGVFYLVLFWPFFCFVWGVRLLFFARLPPGGRPAGRA